MNRSKPPTTRAIDSDPVVRAYVTIYLESYLMFRLRRAPAELPEVSLSSVSKRSASAPSDASV